MHVPLNFLMFFPPYVFRIDFQSFNLTRVRSLSTLVTNSLPNWRFDWCDLGVWRCQLITCWCCYCRWCWWRGTCCWQFERDFEADVWSKYQGWGLFNFLSFFSDRFGEYFEVEVQEQFWSWSLVNILMVMCAFLKLKLGRYSGAEFWPLYPRVRCAFGNF